MSSYDDLLKVAGSSYKSEAERACGQPPAMLSKQELEAYAKRCGEKKALELVSQQLGVPQTALVEAATGKVDWKKAAIKAVNLEGLTGIQGANGWLTDEGDVNWGTIAVSAGTTGASAACVATGVGALVAPICGVLGGLVAGAVIEGVTGLFKADEPPVSGRYLAWHMSPPGMIATAAQYLVVDDGGPGSFGFSEDTEATKTLAEWRKKPGLARLAALDFYYLCRLTVLEMCAAIDAAVVMWETGTRQKLGQVGGKSAWREMYDTLQENGLHFDENMFYFISHKTGMSGGEMQEIVTSTVTPAYSSYTMAMHDLASFALRPENDGKKVSLVGGSVKQLVLGGFFGLTKYDELSWQEEQRLYPSNNAYGEYVLGYTVGYFDYTTYSADNQNNMMAWAGGVFPQEAYVSPTPGWSYAVGPYASGSSQIGEYAIRPAMLFFVWTNAYSEKEQDALSRPVMTYPEGSYFYLPGMWWSRHLYGQPAALGQTRQSQKATGLEIVHAFTVGTNIDVITNGPVYPYSIAKASIGAPSAWSSDRGYDRLVLEVNKNIWRNCRDRPETIVAWASKLKARLERAIGILRQSIRQYRRDNMEGGEWKPSVSKVSVSSAFKQVAPYFDTGFGGLVPTLKPDGERERERQGSSVLTYAAGGAVLLAAGYYGYRWWQKRRR